MQFLKKIILSFCMVAVLLSSMPLCVFASDLSDGVNDGYDRFMGGHNIEGFNTWESTDKKSFTLANIGSFFASIGMYFKGMSNESLMDILIEHLIESGRIADAESTDEYIASHLTANEEETELYLSNDFTNALYETSVQYINNSQNWINFQTIKPSQVDTSYFNTQTAYNTFANYVNGSENLNKIFFIKGIQNISIENADLFGIPNDGTSLVSGTCVYVIDLATDCITYEYSSSRRYFYFYSDWLSFKPPILFFNNDGGVYTLENTYLNESNVNTYENYRPPRDVWRTRFVNQIPKVYRLYESIDDFKEYSVGYRPYYVTEKFTNYDSTVDNSTTITQTEIDNSVTYGDVYNYITNNYENPDGLTEDELRAILEEYLSQINNSGGNGSSSGSGDSGGSGGGLSGFLDGLGSLGDALLAIIGKLLEYVGKAIELLSGTVTKVIDLVPQNITSLISGLFPFIPQEWLVAIELSLVLAVVIGIVGIFKK